jgi:hypothetical protein
MNSISISISTAEELSTFCHELSKQINKPASSIKSAIAKMHGYKHVSTYMKVLDEQAKINKGGMLAIAKMRGYADLYSYEQVLREQAKNSDIFMSDTEWLDGFEVFFLTHDVWSSRAKLLLFLMLHCIKDRKPNSDDIGISLSELLAISTPLKVTEELFKTCAKTNNGNLYSHIVQFLKNTPGGNFTVGNLIMAFASYKVSGTFETTPAFIEQIGYLTMQVESFLKEHQGYILY